MLGIYIHIPFCKKKCPYCNFYSVSFNKTLEKKYMAALFNELKAKSNKSIIVDTIYFGGGTPSILNPNEIVKILYKLKKYFLVKKNAEITIEINPTTVSKEKLDIYKKIGINRLSFGVQSFNNYELKSLGRSHTKIQAINIIRLANLCGFSNISVDIMIGIPNQTKKSLQQTLKIASCLKIDHISIYQLKIEKNTKFYIYPPKGLPTNDEVAGLYFFACEFLKNNGFLQYEISNFAKEGKKSKHNLKYWEMKEYLGFGPSAHSFFEKERFYNLPFLESYIKNSTKTKKEPIEENYEWFILGLRLKKGLEIEKLKLKNFWTEEFKEKLKKLLKEKLLKIDNDKVALTTKGMLLQNSIILYLLEKK